MPTSFIWARSMSEGGPAVTLWLKPAAGWVDFEGSDPLVEWLSEQLSSWHYMSFTSDSSTWECPADRTLVSVAIESVSSSLFKFIPDRSLE